ncbi:MAG: hypothetical protein Q9226_006958 [Calogaya cf. arnoldii]
MATTNPDKAAETTAPEPSQPTKDNINDTVEADETTDNEWIVDLGIPHPRNLPASSDLAKVGYKILKGEKCNPKFPTFDFDIATKYDSAAISQIRKTLSEHDNAAAFLEYQLNDQFEDEYTIDQGRRFCDQQITKDAFRAWNEQIEGLSRKAGNWVKELEELENREYRRSLAGPLVVKVDTSTGMTDLLRELANPEGTYYSDAMITH